MRLLSIDLAYRTYGDNGFVVLARNSTATLATIIPPVEFATEISRAPDPRLFAASINRFCENEKIKALILDGPQAWKCPLNGLEHSRRCERELNTPAKTGLPGSCRPRNYIGFVTFSIRLFEELRMVGWGDLVDSSAPYNSDAKMLFESFPNAAWRGLGVQTIGAKRRCSKERIAEYRDILESRNIQITGEPTHDDLQATIGGLGALSYMLGDYRHRFAGIAPVLRDGTTREGFIVTPDWKQ